MDMANEKAWMDALLSADIGDLDRTATPAQIEETMRTVARAFSTRRLLRDALYAALEADPVDAEKDLALALKFVSLRASAIARQFEDGTAT
jgi:hypothetical protein